MEDSRPLKVAVLSRFALVRAGVTHLVQSNAGQATVVQPATHDAGHADVDAVVYDLDALEDDETRGDLQRLVGLAPVVGLARQGRPRLTEAARALGVRHTVEEGVSAGQLLTALQQAAGRTGERRGFDPAALSSRERAVLGLVGAGHSNDEIGRELYITLNTVKTYIRSAYRKIGVGSRSEAVLWAVRNGVAPTGERSDAAPS